ncbi:MULTISPECIES: M1 family metallopeptidase [Dermacoccus]|uniref:Aminopeptidase N n=2 Tax=Dermacoccus TaxID=57495 RepID=A0A417Z6H7_9MICO|nr:M1 family metallopeptidase [Dermacoccus abyssi]RHW46218.1 M1 family peptidase [Dermacoccus abyssi]
MKRCSWRRAAAISTVVLTPMGVATAAVAPSGSAGIGDPYYPNYGNGGYDVDHYSINVEYDRTKNTVKGKTWVFATTKQSLGRFNLDLALRAKLVTVNGRPAKFTQSEHELVVTPSRALKKGESMAVEVTYGGNPSTTKVKGFTPWVTTPDGAAALGEPESAAWWYPSNDHPRDKATYDIAITVPKGVEALSNGTLQSNKVSGPWQTWRWQVSQPMAPYLAFFVTGQFTITKGTSQGIPWLNAVTTVKSPQQRYAAADLARTPEIVAWEAKQFGPYPFETMGGVAPNAPLGFALENQTRPVYSNVFWADGPSEGVIVHEQAHQWFGDSVSVHNWKDIWLNEGFATYATWLWSEKQGEGSRQDLLESYYLTPPDEDFWSTTIGDPGAGNEFDAAVYDRGAMTLAALRNRVGEAKMSKILKTWTRQKADGNARIADFIALAERISGQQLDSFFTAWLYTPQRPAATKANGFPATFAKRASTARTQRVAMPASRAQLDADHKQMIAQERQRVVG